MKIHINGQNGRLGSCISKMLENKTYSAKEADVIIDVSHPNCLEEILCWGKPLVIGTTGYSLEQMKQIEEGAKKLPIFKASNFSLGIALLQKFLLEHGEYFMGKPAAIIETHHEGKVDAPSGTALELGKNLGECEYFSRRTPNAVGEHEVRIGLRGEELRLGHIAHSRELFARGAIRAAEFMLGKKAGLYGMKELIESPL
ncbi:MAG: hypothetical protein MRY21_04710 [Simkaniaceae bacterium]|nr:hypothetical protein [Simkaniaceae bacterium]